jgi:small GTP-binding protein
MIAKKICMVGAFGVGKTSLVRRFVYSIFSEEYQTTIGVMISKKNLTVDDQEYQLIIWDLEGKDELTEFRASYLRGVAGILYVADTTRPQTLSVVHELQGLVLKTIGKVPGIVLLNKSDLVSDPTIEDKNLDPLRLEGYPIVKTSAKDGSNVESSFEQLIRLMMKPVLNAGSTT